MITYKLQDNGCIHQPWYNPEKYPSHDLPDWRVDLYQDGVWQQDFEGSYTKAKAEKVMAYLINVNSYDSNDETGE